MGTDIRGDKINGAPKGVAEVRRGCAVRPCIPGDNKRDSAADWAKRLQSSSHANIWASGKQFEIYDFIKYNFIINMLVSLVRS